MKQYYLTKPGISTSLSICLLLVFLFLPLRLWAKESPIFNLSLYDNPIHKTIALIEDSTKEIKGVVYKFEDKSLLAAIKKAHDRGVDILLVVDQKEAESKKSKVAQAVAHGVKVRTWSQGKLHAKFAIIDSSKVITGSFNWTKSAKNKNVELISNYHDPSTAKRFVYLFDDLWNRAAPESQLPKPDTQRKAEAVQ